eukprot:gene2753-2793_t
MLRFDGLYKSYGVRGMEFSDRVRGLVGGAVAITGYMAPPLKAESKFFVLSREPLSICPFCESDADWPVDIVVVYLRREGPLTEAGARVTVSGRLEIGSWSDPDSGFTTRVADRGALALADVRVVFSQGGACVVAVEAAALSVAQGDLLGISGPSGSGKTTLLHVLAGLLKPNAGSVRWGDDLLTAMREDARDRWRRQHVGFVFQDFHLVPELSARDNVLLPLWFGGWRAPSEAVARATSLLEQVGIPDPERPAGAVVADLLVRSAAEVGATLVLVSHDPAMLGRMAVVRRMEKGVLLA